MMLDVGLDRCKRVKTQKYLKMKDSPSLTAFFPYNLKDSKSVKAGTVLQETQKSVRDLACRGKALGTT